MTNVVYSDIIEFMNGIKVGPHNNMIVNNKSTNQVIFRKRYPRQSGVTTACVRFLQECPNTIPIVMGCVNLRCVEYTRRLLSAHLHNKVMSFNKATFDTSMLRSNDFSGIVLLDNVTWNYASLTQKLSPYVQQAKIIIDITTG